MSELDDIDDDLIYPSNVSILPSENGKHWYDKIQQFLRRKVSFSSSQTNDNSVLERR